MPTMATARVSKKPMAIHKTTPPIEIWVNTLEADLFVRAHQKREEAELFMRATAARQEAELFMRTTAAGRQIREKDHPSTTAIPSMAPVRRTKKQPHMTLVHNHKPAPPAIQIQIRSVWADNLEEEFKLIRATIARHPYAAIDTEFPGAIHQPSKHYFSLSADERYALLKANVDDLKLIQVGLTLSDASGRLPDLGTGGAARFVWEFNLRDFDVHRDRHNPASIALLQHNGIDFEKNMSEGIDSRRFAQLLVSSGLVCNGSRMSWVAFSSGHDFAYLIKILTHQKLPETMEGFLKLLTYFFGTKVFDMKYVMKFSSMKLQGGLERVASELKVTRAAGRCHQAGSDSLLTCQAFQKMSLLLPKDGWEQYHGVLCGLQVC